MAVGEPIRIDDGICSAAGAVASSMGRGAAQQAPHRARLGRGPEEAGSLAARQTAEVVGGGACCDDLGDPGAGAIARAVWDEQMEQRR